MFLFVLFLFLNISLISSSIQIIKVRENVNVTITCHFDRIKTKLISTNSSENIILWYKDDTQVIGVNSISNNPKKYILNQFNIHTYQLTILNVQLESSGLYKCQNFTAKEENHFQLNVIVPPSRLYLISSIEMPVNDGTLVIFNCTSERVYPQPTFEWYKNNKLIQRSIGNQTDSVFFSSSSILTLLLTPADHNHILRCQVSNEASIEPTNTEVKIDILFKPIIKILSNENELTKTLNVIENTSEIIHCKIFSNPSIISNIEWFKNDQLIIGDNQEELRMNFTDIQKLTCQAKNIIGQTDTTINVNLLYKPKLSMIENITLNQNEKLVLKCFIDSNPSCYQIRWLFNEKELTTQPCQISNITEYIIENLYRSHAGKYTCEVRNWLNTSFSNQYDGITQISTDVRVQYAPFILNSYNKLAVVENEGIIAECFVDAYPKADIIWFGPSGQRLNSFTKEKFVNKTVILSELHLPSSYSSILGLYRCVAKNIFGQHEFSIDFQRPGLPDPPTELQVINLTHSSFVLNWQAGYNGGSNQIFYIILNGNQTEERETNLNSIRFEDLNEKSRYMIKIRSKNEIGFSDYSNNLVLITKECPVRSEEFPSIQQAYFTKDKNRIRFRLTPALISIHQLCINYYNTEEIPSCIPLNSLHSSNDELEIDIKQMNKRLKLCLINQTDVCSKPIIVSIDNQLSNDSSDMILILIGGILGLCFVIGVICLFICLHQQICKRKSKNGSTDTLKTNSDNFQTLSPVRVTDAKPSLYYPTYQTRISYFNDETTGVYSIQEKKNSFCFDSGMPSTTSNNSDSANSQALSSSDFYDRSDGDYLVTTNKILSAYRRENLPINGRISSEEESGFSTPTKTHYGKKLVYEVVV